MHLQRDKNVLEKYVEIASIRLPITIIFVFSMWEWDATNAQTVRECWCHWKRIQTNCKHYFYLAAKWLQMMHRNRILKFYICTSNALLMYFKNSICRINCLIFQLFFMWMWFCWMLGLFVEFIKLSWFCRKWEMQKKVSIGEGHLDRKNFANW